MLMVCRVGKVDNHIKLILSAMCSQAFRQYCWCPFLYCNLWAQDNMFIKILYGMHECDTYLCTLVIDNVQPYPFWLLFQES